MTAPTPGDAGFDLETVDRLLSTTRAVRRRLDLERPVPLELIEECLELAIQAPTGTSLETWRWLVITDPVVKQRLGQLYRAGAPAHSRTDAGPDVTARLSEATRTRLNASTDHLRNNIERVPVLVVPCVEAIGGAAGWAPSIYPAVWSLMLALRSRGLGSVMTTVHLYHRDEADELLGVPDGFVQTCLVPVAYTIGTDFKPAKRRPVREVAFLDRWGQPLG
ncbi:MAG TPA: nitroreductase family protein [Acidimicrobiales bacterium]|nr:nitroreductase family protein [Acidimicrobiales bacterium]